MISICPNCKIKWATYGEIEDGYPMECMCGELFIFNNGMWKQLSKSSIDEKITRLDQFQDLSKRTLNNLLTKEHALINYSMGASGESGEVIELIKKHVFHGHELDNEKLKEELGDVLFYVAALATTAGLKMSDVATYNVDKLRKRYKNGFSIDESVNRKV